jgi:hypothetical protein
LDSFLKQVYLRQRLDRMTDAELQRIVEYQWQLFLDMVKHIEEKTGRTFDDVTAQLIAKRLSKGLVDLEWAKQTVRNWPALVPRLLTYLPDAECLKDIAALKQLPPREPKNNSAFLHEAWAATDMTDERHREFKAKVDNGTATHVDHLMELATEADALAAMHHLNGPCAVKCYIREKQIGAIMWFLSLLMTPGAGMVDPWQEALAPGQSVYLACELPWPPAGEEGSGQAA